MKILIIRTIAIEEDLSTVTYNNQGIGLATELAKLGNEVALVYYTKPGNGIEEVFCSDNQKIKIYHIEGKNLVWNAIYDKSLYTICNEYDLIQVSECDQIASWQVYKRFPSKTVIYHGPYSSKFTWKYNIRSKVFDAVFSWRNGFKNAPVISKSYLAEEYLRKKGFKNIETIGVGLNPIVLEQDLEDRPAYIDELCQNKADSKYLLYVGAISKRKNLLFILQVLDILVNQMGNVKYKLIIIGGEAYKEQAYYKECFSFIEQKGLSNNVIYLGTVEQKYLKYIYSICDLYLLATQYDIFGMVYLEAMYFGTPILTTMCGGSSLLIKEGQTGFIRDLCINDWCITIQDLFKDSYKIKLIRENGKKLIKNEYLWEKLALRFLKIYEEILYEK